MLRETELIQSEVLCGRVLCGLKEHNERRGDFAARSWNGCEFYVPGYSCEVRSDRYHALRFFCESWGMRFRVSVRTGVFTGFFAQKCARIRTKPKKTGKNLWKPENSG
jgi:hypothetical protein